MVLHLTLRNAPFRSSLLGCHVSIHPASPPVNLRKYTRIHFNIACREAKCQCATAKFKIRLHEILTFGILACYACTFVFPGTASNFKAGNGLDTSNRTVFVKPKRCFSKTCCFWLDKQTLRCIIKTSDVFQKQRRLRKWERSDASKPRWAEHFTTSARWILSFQILIII